MSVCVCMFLCIFLCVCLLYVCVGAYISVHMGGGV